MILYRCGTSCPVGEIPPSNWATGSIALEYFIDRCEENGIDCGDKIFVIEIPAQSPVDIGPYCRINGRKADGDLAHPFGDDKDGWWSFNQPYSGPFRVIDVLSLKGLSMTDIDLLDTRYKPREEWPKGVLALVERLARK